MSHTVIQKQSITFRLYDGQQLRRYLYALRVVMFGVGARRRRLAVDSQTAVRGELMQVVLRASFVGRHGRRGIAVQYTQGEAGCQDSQALHERAQVRKRRGVTLGNRDAFCTDLGQGLGMRTLLLQKLLVPKSRIFPRTACLDGQHGTREVRPVSDTKLTVHRSRSREPLEHVGPAPCELILRPFAGPRCACSRCRLRGSFEYCPG